MTYNMENLGSQLIDTAKYLLQNENLCALIADMGDNPLDAEVKPTSIQVFKNNLGFLPEFELTDAIKTVKINLLISEIESAKNDRNNFADITLSIDFIVPNDKVIINGDLRHLAIHHQILESLEGHHIGDLGSLEWVISKMIVPSDYACGYSMLYVFNNFK